MISAEAAGNRGCFASSYDIVVESAPELVETAPVSVSTRLKLGEPATNCVGAAPALVGLALELVELAPIPLEASGKTGLLRRGARTNTACIVAEIADVLAAGHSKPKLGMAFCAGKPQARGVVEREGCQAKSDLCHWRFHVLPFGRLGPQSLVSDVATRIDSGVLWWLWNWCSLRPHSSREHTAGQRTGTCDAWGLRRLLP